MSTVGAFFSAKSQQDGFRHQARMADINAKIADENARAEVEKGNFQESQIKLQGSRLKSAQTARFAASGVDIAGSGSAIAVLTGSEVLTEVDANRARANATRAAWGQRIEAGNMRRTANSLRASAEGTSPGLAAVTSLISGAGRVASSWYSLDRQGAFDDAPKQGKVTMEPSAPSLTAPNAPPPIDSSLQGSPGFVSGNDPYGGFEYKLWGW